MPMSYLRVRALPLAKAVHDFVKNHDRVYVVEQNRDGQLIDRLRIELPALAERLVPVLHYDGLPLDAQSVTDKVLAHERAAVAQGATR
jgi:2-oxoglutarate ferredoxin oxidoreductase subunit alpha